MDILELLQRNIQSDNPFVPVEYQEQLVAEMKWVRAEREMFRKESYNKEYQIREKNSEISSLEWKCNFYLRALEKIGVVAAGITPGVATNPEKPKAEE
jgi:hypothetical protein